MHSVDRQEINEVERLHELFELASDNAGLGIFYYDLVQHPGFFYAQDKTIELIGGELRADKLYQDDVWLNFMAKQTDRSLAEHVLEQFEGTWSGKYNLYDVEYPSPIFNPPKWLAAKAKVTKFDQDGKPLNMIGILIDITKQKAQHDLIEQQKKALKNLAYKDQLTGLKNRLAFYEFIESQTATILFIDLDGFKQVNDNNGHEAGDQLLQRVSNKLIDITSNNGASAYRIAGDEFIVTLDDRVSPNMVIKLAEQIRVCLKESMMFGATEHTVTCSIGVCLYQGQTDMNTVVKQADTAMYLAKKAGKNRYVIA